MKGSFAFTGNTGGCDYGSVSRLPTQEDYD